MRRLLDIPEYAEDVRNVASRLSAFDSIAEKKVLITGGTGLIGSFLVDVLEAADLGCHIFLLGRSMARAKSRFPDYWDNGRLHFVEWDASAPTVPHIDAEIDFVLHLASNTHPVAYATDPIGTVVMNVIALDKLLSLASEMGARRFLFASSNEIYGENRGDVEFFDEKYCGYIDCNTLRAGYPESKRCGEALCQAYLRQKGLDCVIARLTRTYGPTVLSTDTKAINQFFGNALRGEDIVLKSEGNQFFSYQYVSDSVSGLLTVLQAGEPGQAYNVADESGDITLRDLASLVAAQSGRGVIFDVPDSVESAGFSKATKARLNGAKLKMLGWRPTYDIAQGVARTYKCLKMMER